MGKDKILLCTFAHASMLDLTLDYIRQNYDVKKIIVFKNKNMPDELYLLYVCNNVTRKLKNTISVHFKSEYNVIYTLNALNEIISNANNGYIDKSFELNWELYKNTMLIIRDGILQRIPIIHKKTIMY